MPDKFFKQVIKALILRNIWPPLAYMVQMKHRFDAVLLALGLIEDFLPGPIR